MNQRYGMGNGNHVMSPPQGLAVLSKMLPCGLRSRLLLEVCENADTCFSVRYEGMDSVRVLLHQSPLPNTQRIGF